MAQNYEKKFYKKILSAIDREDSNEFYKEFTNAIKSGQMVVSQKRRKSQITFDDTWITVISNYLPYVEKIVRNPRLYMVAEESVMPIQSAKKINAKSVQHLSSHVQNVQEIRDDGTVVPNKVLSVTYEDTLNIYENRFVMTLITKLAAFVETRYDQIKDNIQSYKSDIVSVKDNFTWKNYTIDASIDLKVREDANDDLSKKNEELIEKIATIRRFIKGFINSPFINSMKEVKARPVTPPILRTNIIVKQVDYSSCLKLWQFLDSYRQLGVEAGVFDKDMKFDETYLDDVSDMILLNYSLVASNQEDRAKDYNLIPYKYKKTKQAVQKELLVVTDELDEKEIDTKVKDPSVSEYFYQRMKKNYKTDFTQKVNSGISYNKSFVSVYRNMLRIENGIQGEIIEAMGEKLKEKYPDRIDSKAKQEYLKKQKAIYKSVLMVKKQDLAKAERKLASLDKELAKYEKGKAKKTTKAK